MDKIIQELQRLTYQKGGKTSLVELIEDFKKLYPQEKNAIFAVTDFAFNESLESVSSDIVIELLKNIKEHD